MREPVRDRERLEHIIEAIDRILTFTEGKKAEEWKADKMQYYGVVKNIEIIGEAAYKLTKIFRNEHSETPWDDIVKMRHILIHDYYQINDDAVVYVIEDNLSPLREQVSRYISETNWEEWNQKEQVISETAAHKSLVQTASRMKKLGYNTNEICKITGLSRDEIEDL